MAVYRYAGFWRRLVAYTVDNIILNIVFIVLTVIVTTAFVLGSMSANSRAWVADLTDPARINLLLLPVTALYMVMSIAYFTYFHGIKGRTPGKMLMGLEVLSTNGTPIGFGIAFLRSVGYLVSSIFYLGFIWAAFDKRKQGWHDKIAGTVVIIRPDEGESAGLTIGPAAEKQSDTVSQVAQQSGQTSGENAATPDQAESNDQKIP